MDQEDKQRFLDNVQWFNDFFDDLHHLLTAISEALIRESMATKRSLWYYQKSRHIPKIPKYYLLAMSAQDSAIQVFAVLDPDILKRQPAFINEPSMILIKHSRSDKVGYINDFGLRIIRNSAVAQEVLSEGIISGEISGGSGVGTKFLAFQVPFDEFSENKDPARVIENRIVKVFKEYNYE